MCSVERFDDWEERCGIKCCGVFPYRSDCCGTPLVFDMFLDPVLKNVRDIQVVLVHHHHVVVAENTALRHGQPGRATLFSRCSLSSRSCASKRSR
jgi:hypothetical protein